jgi:hypothetical protein
MYYHTMYVTGRQRTILDIGQRPRPTHCCTLFNRIHVITHLPENVWLLLYHNLSSPH